MVNFQEGIAIKPKSSHEYEAHFHGNWCIGSVPHGGYITSCFLQVAKTHFSKTLSSQNQPHTITLHLEFVRRTEVGPATFKVRDVKVGRLTSTIHVSLFQNGREEVIGYLTNSNIPREDGPSYDTRWRLEPPPVPLSSGSTAALADGTDAEWREQKNMPFSDFRKASQNVRFFFPARGQPDPGVADQWMAFRNGERFTNASLGLVADMFPQIPESFRSRSDLYAVGVADSAAAAKKKSSAAKFWYPTLLLNLDVKKALPEEGVCWLFVRTRAKQIRNGRYDLEVVIMDELGDIVALSHHVCMILPASRNLAARNTANTDAKL